MFFSGEKRVLYSELNWLRYSQSSRQLNHAMLLEIRKIHRL